MNLMRAERMAALPVNYFTTLGERIAALEREGKHVIRLDIGSPDFSPPEDVIKKLQQSAADSTSHGYQPHRGIPALRRAWAAYYQKRHDVELDPERQVLPLIGSKEGIFHLSLALVDPGQRVVVPDPGYQTYAAGARFCGGETIPVSCQSAAGFVRSLKRLPGPVLAKVKLLWVNFPHNPTGATADVHHLQEILDLARKHDILVCHDGAYTQVTYDGYAAPSLMELDGATDTCIEFNSLSKSHNMAGWRMGVVVGHPGVLDALYRLKTHADSGQFLPLLDAAVTALRSREHWVEERNRRYRARRDLVLEGLNAAGIEAAVPRGGIYVWFPVPDRLTSEEWARALLETVQVSLTPGSVFGAGGEGYLRLSLTSSLDTLGEGMDRLRSGLAHICGKLDKKGQR